MAQVFASGNNLLAPHRLSCRNLTVGVPSKPKPGMADAPEAKMRISSKDTFILSPPSSWTAASPSVTYNPK